MLQKDMEYCLDEQENAEIDYDDFIDCTPLEEANNNNNYANNKYYVGTHCVKDGLYLGTFTDAMCTVEAKAGTYESYMGYGLPSNNLIPDTCISCKEPNEEAYNYYGNDANDDDEVLEVCEQLYTYSGKCETNIEDYQAYKKDESACDILKEIDSSWFNGMTWFQTLVMKSLACVALFLLGTTLFFVFKSRLEMDTYSDARNDKYSTWYSLKV